MTTNHLLKIAATSLAALLLFWGCDVTDTVYVHEPDTTPPGVPRGVSSITGDQQVTLTWLGSTEEDLSAYLIWRDDDDSDDIYDRIGTVDAASFRPQWTFVDHDVDNGRTYLYAVSAVDYDDNESELSYEDVFDTPRPEGFNVYIDATSNPSGFNFLRRARVNDISPDADIVFTYDAQLDAIFIEAANNDDDVQDFGYTESLDDLDWAPQDGWSSVGWCEVILGHTYVVWTDANRYAKVRVFEMGQTWVRFDWAHQEDPGNPELKPVVPGNAKTANP